MKFCTNRNLLKQLSLFWGLLILFCMTTSCRSTHSTIKDPLKEKGESFLFQEMTKAEADFDWFESRCDIQVITDKKSKTDLNGQIRIKKDSIIWFSLSATLGIEVARVKITPDSVFFINRLNKSYFTGNINFLENMFQTKIDFYIIQSLLIGNDLSNYENFGLKASIENGEYKLSAAKKAKLKREIKKNENQNILVQNIWLHPQNFKITKVNLKEFDEINETKKLQIEYSDFENIENQVIPSTLLMTLHADNRMDISIHYSKINLTEKQAFPFKIPNKYNQINIH